MLQIAAVAKKPEAVDISEASDKQDDKQNVPVFDELGGNSSYNML